MAELYEVKLAGTSAIPTRKIMFIRWRHHIGLAKPDKCVPTYTTTVLRRRSYHTFQKMNWYSACFIYFSNPHTICTWMERRYLMGCPRYFSMQRRRPFQRLIWLTLGRPEYRLTFWLPTVKPTCISHAFCRRDTAKKYKQIKFTYMTEWFRNNCNQIICRELRHRQTAANSGFVHSSFTVTDSSIRMTTRLSLPNSSHKTFFVLFNVERGSNCAP